MSTSVKTLRRDFPVNCVVWNKAPLMPEAVSAIVVDYYKLDSEWKLKLWDGKSDGFWLAPAEYCQRKPLKVTIGEHVRDRRDWAIARDHAGRSCVVETFVKDHARKHGSAVLIESSDEGIMWVRCADGKLSRKSLGLVSYL